MNGDLEKIMKALTDEYAIKILVASYHREKSAIELSQELDVPIAACYRRLHMLQELGLLAARERVNGKGKKTRYYNSLIKRARISIEDNHVVVEVTFRSGDIRKFEGEIVRKGYGK